MTFLRKFLFVFLGTSVVVAGAGYSWVESRLGRPDVQNFIRLKAGRFFHSEVEIRGVAYQPPASVALTGLRISSSGKDFSFSVSRVQKLIFGYGLFNLIRRDFKIPSRLVLEHPQIYLSSRRSAGGPLLQTLFSAEGIPAQLAIRHGEIHCPWDEQGRELILSDVQLKTKLLPNSQIEMRLNTRLAGVAQGSLTVRGITDLNMRHYRLEVELKGVSLIQVSEFPLKNLHGRFVVTEKQIEAIGATGLFHNWDIEWKGKMENWKGASGGNAAPSQPLGAGRPSGHPPLDQPALVRPASEAKPRLLLEMGYRKGDVPVRVRLHADLNSETLQGILGWGAREYPFAGKISEEGPKTRLQALTFPHGYTGRGEINWAGGDYSFWIEREKRRVQIHSNLNQLEFETGFQFDHIPVNGMDWVTAGRAHFTPLEKRAGDTGPRFKGSVVTDYLIAATEPLYDFKGSFELSSEGIQGIRFEWGGVFLMEGRILFKGNQPRSDLVIRVDGFPVESTRRFAGRPLPDNLQGRLEGKLKIRGELGRPDLEGYFTLKDGTVGRLDFDRLILQFQGLSPYMNLYDSKIFKGRNTLELTGAIDLNRNNIFQGVHISGADRLLIWKGMSMHWRDDEAGMQAERPLGGKVTVGLEVGHDEENPRQDEGKESHAWVGPKVKF